MCLLDSGSLPYIIKDVEISEKQIQTGQVKDARESLSEYIQDKTV
jgi:hypothetical protein